MRIISKYLSSIGKWSHELGGITHTLTPSMGDNYKLSQILMGAKKEGNEALLLRSIGSFYEGLVLREYPHLSEEEKRELNLWVEMNVAQIMKDLLIAFRWTTKEKMEDLDSSVGGDKKKLLENL